MAVIVYRHRNQSKSSNYLEVNTMINGSLIGVKDDFHFPLGANKLSGLVARHLPGFAVTQEMRHETDRTATEDPENAT